MEPSINKAEHYNSIAAVYLVVMNWFLVHYSKSLGYQLENWLNLTPWHLKSTQFVNQR